MQRRDLRPSSIARTSIQAAKDAGEKTWYRLGRNAAPGALLLAAIAAVLAVSVLFGDRLLGRLAVIDVALIVILSFLPGWLYVRFIGQRAGAIWDEFVLNLHRLKVDDPQHLPEPPRNSGCWEDWNKSGGPDLREQTSIYRKKFDAYYGRKVAGSTGDSRVNAETFFPVVIATVVIAVGWTAMLWGDAFPEAVPTSAASILGYGFLGAYVFNLQMLGRRFFQRDLKPSAYANVVMRFVVVGATVAVMHQLPMFDNTGYLEAVVAFVVGMFPIVGFQAISRVASRVVGVAVPSMETDYPLSQLDGLNPWYEQRLLEEGIEDMQNLVTANLVDVILHSRVPVGRLVDWCDQAHLMLHLAPLPTGRTGKRQRPSHPRTVLRRVGVKSATTYLKAFEVNPAGQPLSPAAMPAMQLVASQANQFPVDAMVTVARLLGDDPALRPIQAWRQGEGVSGRRALRRVA